MTYDDYRSLAESDHPGGGAEFDQWLLTIEQKAELSEIQTVYLAHANETIATVKEILHQGRHAQVARRALAYIRDRELEPPGADTDRSLDA